MLKRMGQALDDALLILLLAATVSHIAGFMQVYEEPWLWWAAWLQAVGIDLAILRASYLYKTYGAGQARTIALWAIVFFSVCSAILNMAYYVRAGAHVVVAIPMAIFFPVAITILSYLRGVRDVLDERREAAHRRASAVLSGDEGVVSGVRPVRPAGRPDSQRTEALRLASTGRTVREIAAGLGVPRSTVGEWVKGQTSAPDQTSSNRE